MFHPIKLFHDFNVLRANYAEMISALLGYGAAYGDSFLLSVRDNLSVPYPRVKKSKTLEDGTDRLSRNVGKKLSLYAAQYPRGAQTSSTSRKKHEITRICFCAPPSSPSTLCLFRRRSQTTRINVERTVKASSVQY